jgi:hypothetical protein
MGARVYNPETNQFTSKDPIKGGNENSYTYPNDPINGSDFTGLWSLLGLGIAVLGAALGALACVSVAVACLFAGIAIGGLGGFIESSIEANQKGYTGSEWNSYVMEGTVIGMATGLIGGGVASGPLRKAAKEGIDLTITYTRRKFSKELARGTFQDLAVSEALKESWKRIKEYAVATKPSKKNPIPQQMSPGIKKFRNR